MCSSDLEGPLGKAFDLVIPDGKFGEKTWEQAETRLQQKAMELLMKKAGLEGGGPELVFSGDLLNQCVGSSFALRGTGFPALGLYGACSTMAEGLLLAGAAVNAGYVSNAAALSSSHFAAAERQYRFPLAYGGQRTPTAQWTVTGSGAVLVSARGKGPVLSAATVETTTRSDSLTRASGTRIRRRSAVSDSTNRRTSTSAATTPPGPVDSDTGSETVTV